MRAIHYSRGRGSRFTHCGALLDAVAISTDDPMRVTCKRIGCDAQAERDRQRIARGLVAFARFATFGADPLGTACPLCLAPIGVACATYGGVHKTRRLA